MSDKPVLSDERRIEIYKAALKEVNKAVDHTCDCPQCVEICSALSTVYALTGEEI